MSMSYIYICTCSFFYHVRYIRYMHYMLQNNHFKWRTFQMENASSAAKLPGSTWPGFVGSWPCSGRWAPGLTWARFFSAAGNSWAYNPYNMFFLLFIYTCVHIYIYIRTYIYICIYKYIHVCMCVCACVY